MILKSQELLYGILKAPCKSNGIKMHPKHEITLNKMTHYIYFLIQDINNVN